MSSSDSNIDNDQQQPSSKKRHGFMKFPTNGKAILLSSLNMSHQRDVGASDGKLDNNNTILTSTSSTTSSNEDSSSGLSTTQSISSTTTTKPATGNFFQFPKSVVEAATRQSATEKQRQVEQALTPRNYSSEQLVFLDLMYRNDDDAADHDAAQKRSLVNSNDSNANTASTSTYQKICLRNFDAKKAESERRSAIIKKVREEIASGKTKKYSGNRRQRNAPAVFIKNEDGTKTLSEDFIASLVGPKPLEYEFVSTVLGENTSKVARKNTPSVTFCTTQNYVPPTSDTIEQSSSSLPTPFNTAASAPSSSSGAQQNPPQPRRMVGRPGKQYEFAETAFVTQPNVIASSSEFTVTKNKRKKQKASSQAQQQIFKTSSFPVKFFDEFYFSMTKRMRRCVVGSVRHLQERNRESVSSSSSSPGSDRSVEAERNENNRKQQSTTTKMDDDEDDDLALLLDISNSSFPRKKSTLLEHEEVKVYEDSDDEEDDDDHDQNAMMMFPPVNAAASKNKEFNSQSLLVVNQKQHDHLPTKTIQTILNKLKRDPYLLHLHFIVHEFVTAKMREREVNEKKNVTRSSSTTTTNVKDQNDEANDYSELLPKMKVVTILPASVFDSMGDGFDDYGLGEEQEDAAAAIADSANDNDNNTHTNSGKAKKSSTSSTKQKSSKEKPDSKKEEIINANQQNAVKKNFDESKRDVEPATPWFEDERARLCQHFFIAEKAQLGNTDATLKNLTRNTIWENRRVNGDGFSSINENFDENFWQVPPRELLIKRRSDLNALDVVLEIETIRWVSSSSSSSSLLTNRDDDAAATDGCARSSVNGERSTTMIAATIELVDVRVPLDSLRIVFPQLIVDYFLETTMLLPVVEYGKKK